ncbi:MAG: glycosyltransferase [Bacteroidota bacterium]
MSATAENKQDQFRKIFGRKPRLTQISILNPVYHTRILAKWAYSLVDLGFEVGVIGQGEGSRKFEHQVELIPQGVFGRLGRKRWLFPWSMAKLALKEEADVYLIHAPELLITAAKLKKRRSCRVLYDVHENYQANLRQGAHWPRGIRLGLGWIFGLWERYMVGRWVDGVILAEAVYASQLRFPKVPTLVLENKALSRPAPPYPHPRPYLIYTGTLAREWGIFEAIELWEEWHALQPIDLIIAGHTQQAVLLRELQERIKRTAHPTRIHLMGGNTYLPHAQILSLIAGCVAGLGLYQDLPQLRGKIPTKFYEFMAAGRPLIFSALPEWNLLNQATPFGFAKPSEALSLAWIQGLGSWQAPNLAPEAYDWKSQEARLGDWLQKILTQPTE